MSADAQQNLKDNLKYWADLDKTEFKNDFIRLYNSLFNQDNPNMISVEVFETIYQNAKDLAFVFLENFDHFLMLIDEPSLFMLTVSFTTKALKRNIEIADNSDFIATFVSLTAFNAHLSGFLAQVRTDSGKIR